jgi:hypothetical protein
MARWQDVLPVRDKDLVAAWIEERLAEMQAAPASPSLEAGAQTASKQEDS